jgi:hypothetical protein
VHHPYDDDPTYPQGPTRPHAGDDPTQRYTGDEPTQRYAGDEPTVRLDAPPDVTMPIGPPDPQHQTMSHLPQDHSRSMTVGAALPRRVPAPRVSESVPVESASQHRITLRIGRGVEAVERSRQVRSAARRVGATAWRVTNIVLTLAILAAASWAGWLWWQRWHPQLAVEHVSVSTATPAGGPCDTEYDFVGTISTNGKTGTVTYQWVRSDGAATKHLTVNVPAGRTSTTVHLYWTFSGAGTQSGTATLRVVDPEPAEASAQISYACLTR